MAHDMFGLRRNKGDDAPDPDETRTPEEEALLEKAREEAARRAEERRGTADDVGDFLSDMLDASAPPSAEEEPEEEPSSGKEPSVNLDLGGEVRRPSVEAAAPSPFAAFAESAEEHQPIIRRASQIQGVRPEDEVPQEGPSGRELSPLMTIVRDELMDLGRSSADAQLSFEPEASAGDASRTMEVLVRERRRHPPPLAFEPDEAAGARQPGEANAPFEDSPDGEPPAEIEEAPAGVSFEDAPIVPPLTEAVEDVGDSGDSSLISREYSLDDLPDSDLPEAAPQGGAELQQPAEDDTLQDGDLTGVELLSAAEEEPDDDAGGAGSGTAAEGDESEAGGDYGLDDLPSAPDGAESPGEDADAPVEPAMEETSLDDRELDAALAAAGEPAPSEEKEPEARPGQSAEPAMPARAVDGEAVPDPAETRPTERTQASYDLGDLPAVPDAGDMPLASDERTDSRGEEDQLVDQSLPDLVPPTAAGAAAETPQSPEASRQSGYTVVERAMDDRVEPSPDVSGAPESGGLEDLSGAEHAADLSLGQLAEVERLLEKEVEFEENRTAETDLLSTTQSRFSALAERFNKVVQGLAALQRQACGFADGKLAPYSLSCRVLLGIAGIITLAIVGALSVKTWILPT